jgi:multiple sugar transport system ATP-binding protein
MAEVVLEDVGKVYDDGTRAVTGLSIDVVDGEFLVLVGPSGCGKSTALRMIAGLEDISEGKISIGGRVVNNVPSRDRDVAMVFQSYALYPHLSVRDNIGFGLKLRKLPKAEIRERVDKAAKILGLEAHLERKPRNLSGGQRQRVAMGRAIVREPQAFLMDEPLSNLDAKLRVQMRAEIGYLQNDLGVTTIYVTHDQTEAMTLGDRVAVMKAGVLQQIAPPQELYDHPINLFVASFIGSPAMNLVHGTLTENAGRLSVRLGETDLDVDPAVLESRPGLRAFFGKEIVVGIRPEDLEDARLSDDSEGKVFTAPAILVEPMGSDVMAHLTLAARGATGDSLDDTSDETGARREDLETTTIVARLNPRTTVALGDQVPIHVDTSRLHYFALDSGAAIWND